MVVTALAIATMLTVPTLSAQVLFDETVFPTGECPAELTAHDVDADGDLDVIFVTHHSHDLRTLLNDGTGTFTAGGVFPVPGLVEPHPISLTLADFDGDGLLDVAVVGHLNDEGHRFLADGLGNYVDPQPLPSGAFPLHIDSGDFDEDGIVDLVTANRDNDSISFIRGLGAGNFAPHVTTPVGDGPTALLAVDLDSDAHVDLVVANSFAGTVEILYGIGDGTFTAGNSFTGLPFASSIIAPDLEGDGLRDLVITHDLGVSAIPATGVRAFGSATLLLAGGQPRNAVAVDIIGGPALDLVLARPGTDDLAFLEGDGLGGFTFAGVRPAGNDPFGIAAADFDADGLVDLAFSDEAANTAIVLGNLGEAHVFTRGDSNADGNLDIADPILALERGFVIAGQSVYTCRSAEDSNDDGLVNIADPIFVLSHLFTGGPPPPPPFGTCGSDPTLDGLECDEATACP